MDEQRGGDHEGQDKKNHERRRGGVVRCGSFLGPFADTRRMGGAHTAHAAYMDELGLQRHRADGPVQLELLPEKAALRCSRGPAEACKPEKHGKLPPTRSQHGHDRLKR